MIVEPLALAGVFLVRPRRHADQRGFFARTYCRQIFQDHGLEDCAVQCSISVNIACGTLRGLHYQRQPHSETKLVRCARGAVYDVVLDIQPRSPTFGQWCGIELSEENGHALYIPHGFAHGFLTLHNNVEVHYQMAEAYAPGFAAGVRWNDPSLAIEWPLAPTVINDRDRELPLLAQAEL